MPPPDELSQEPKRLLFFWVYARQSERIRFAEGLTLGYREVFTKFVRSELLRNGWFPDGAGLTAEGSLPKDWGSPFSRLAGKIIGVVVCRPASMTSLLLYLGRVQREVQDFWQLTPLCHSPVLFMHSVAHCILETPLTVFSLTSPGRSRSQRHILQHDSVLCGAVQGESCPGFSRGAWFRSATMAT